MDTSAITNVLNASLGALTLGGLVSALLILVICLVVIRILMGIVTKILEKSNIDLRALSLAESEDFGIVRVIVDNPFDTIQILKGSAYDGFFENVAQRIKAVLTPEMRRTILELKYLTPEEEHIMGIEYYQAVIADGVRNYPDFLEWRKKHPATGIITWCP